MLCVRESCREYAGIVFFSSRRRHTRWPRDWSSDVCSSDLQSGVGFFVIEHGNATVSLKGEILRTLGPGDHIGEIALIDEGPRSATVTATTDLGCRGMAAWEFRSFVQEHPEVAWELLPVLAARFREAEARPGD